MSVRKSVFFLIGVHSTQAQQSLKGMELQEIEDIHEKHVEEFIRETLRKTCCHMKIEKP